MISVSRSINGIPLNGDEYLLNEDGSVMKFENLKEAQDFLKKYVSEEEINSYNYHIE